MPAIKVFAATSKYLAIFERLSDVEKLLDCIASNNGNDPQDFDEIISVAINATENKNRPDIKAKLEHFSKKVNSVELRISNYILLGQLKSAYLLAHKHERLGDIRKILRQAELTNQIHVKKLCEKKLSLGALVSLKQTEQKQ